MNSSSGRSAAFNNTGLVSEKNIDKDDPSNAANSRATGVSDGNQSALAGNSGDDNGNTVTSTSHVQAPKRKHSNIEEPPATSGASGTGYAAKPKPYIQPTLDLPAVMPSDLADWRKLLMPGWAKLLGKKESPSSFVKVLEKKESRSPFVRTTVPENRPPRIVHYNRHSYEPETVLQISSEGMLIHPAPSFRFANLVDDCQYTAWLTFTDLEGTTCVGQYTHPETPRPGDMWEGEVLTFDRLRLYSGDGSGKRKRPITLQNGERYRIEISIGMVDESGHTLSRSVVRKFIDSIFIAASLSPSKKSGPEQGKHTK